MAGVRYGKPQVGEGDPFSGVWERGTAPPSCVFWDSGSFTSVSVTEACPPQPIPSTGINASQHGEIAGCLDKYTL